MLSFVCKHTKPDAPRRHLSDIVLKHMRITILGSFFALMAITIVFVYVYGRNKIEREIFSFLSSMEARIEQEIDNDLTGTARFYADDTDAIIRAEGPEIVADPRFLDYQKGNEEINGYIEASIVDENGIVILSTVDGHTGTDLHADTEQQEFLCLLDGTDVLLRIREDTAAEDGNIICYAGAALHSIRGFYQTCYDINGYRARCESRLVPTVETALIGKTGYLLLFDQTNHIISSPDGRYNGMDPGLSRTPEEMAAHGRIRREQVFGVSAYVWSVRCRDYCLVEVLPLAEAWEKWNVSMLALMVIDAVVFLILFAGLRHLITEHVVRGVYSLNDTLGRITRGSLEEQADFRESIEFDELSDGINHTVDRLKTLIREAEARIDTELALAAQIQRSFLPHGDPPFPDRREFELYASMVPAREIGGDFYDYFLIDEDHLALVIADVSGKGIPAAMFMVMARNRIRDSVMRHGTDVAQAIREANAELIRDNDAMLFVTVWLGVVTISTGHLDYVDAGHEYPALARAGGPFVICEDVHGPFVGIIRQLEVRAGSLELSAGDILYLYTDGITEANPADETQMYTERRLVRALSSTDRTDSLQALDAAVREDIAAFVRGAPQYDDMTTLCFRYLLERGGEHASGRIDENSWFTA